MPVQKKSLNDFSKEEKRIILNSFNQVFKDGTNCHQIFVIILDPKISNAVDNYIIFYILENIIYPAVIDEIIINKK